MPIPEPETIQARLARIMETLEDRLRALGFTDEQLADIKRQAEQEDAAGE